MDLQLSSILPDRLSKRHRLVVYYILGLMFIVLLYSALYNIGMRYFENDPQSVFHSLQIVVETMTTTGYGADSPWESAVMNLYIVFMQISGIGIGFFTLRLIVVPLFSSAEVDLDNRLSPKNNHVVICEYRHDSQILLEELETLDIQYVLISSDEENARKLSNEGYAVIDGSPQDVAAFERASIQNARAVIADAGSANVDTILTVRSLRPDIELVALTDDSDLEEVLLDTGADSVLSPHEVLGQRLAEKVIAYINVEVRDAIELGEDVNVAELPIAHDSDLIGKRIRESRIREQTSANVLGAWIDGELQLPPDPDAVIQPNTVLLVSGSDEGLATLSEFTRPPRVFLEHENVVILGMGEVGNAAYSILDTADVEVVTVDQEQKPNVDVVGDAGSKATLKAAGVGEASAVIVGLPDDSTALLATVLTRALNPNAEILVRVNTSGDTRKALSAGADYVLSVPHISARMVAMELRDEAVIEPASQIRLVEVEATPFAGKSIAESGIFEKTGCRVVAIEDETGVSGVIDPERKLRPTDRLVLVGTDSAVHRFLSEFDVTHLVTEK